MASQRSKSLKLIALVLAICVVQVYVMASPLASVKSTSTNLALLGKLVLSSDQTILVNGNSASSGTTIFSGSQLQTPDGVRGRVQLGEAGSLSIEPNTNLTVTFDKSNVDVSVAQGNAFLLTNAGVKGTITTPDGTTTASTTNPLPAPPASGTAKGATIGGIVFVVIVVTAYVLSNDDDS